MAIYGNDGSSRKNREKGREKMEFAAGATAADGALLAIR